ncbi:MAG: bacillithiol system redox-active protein YtxJ [Acidobacteria bacterium]|nr:MAG: bacillithiol system redox-active protein YtxJ [Acidobacteriota bacterium]
MTELTSPEQLDEVFQLDLVVIFKHSGRCPISRGARSEVERFIQEMPDIPVYLVDVIHNPAVSRSVAERTGIRHESPQTIVLRSGSVIWHASHYDVTKAAIRENLAA